MNKISNCYKNFLYNYYINCHDFEKKNSIIMDNDITIFLIDENC